MRRACKRRVRWHFHRFPDGPQSGSPNAYDSITPCDPGRRVFPSPVLALAYLECFTDPDRDPVWQWMWLNRPAIRNGIATIANAPGLGIVLDQKMISKYRIA